MAKERKPVNTHLPADRLAKLQTCSADGKVPGWGDEGYDDVYEIDADLTQLLRAERDRVGLEGMSAARRTYLVIAELNFNCKADGLALVTTCNDPEVVAAAVQASESMGLSATRALILQVVPFLPPRTAWDREGCGDWIDTEEGQAAYEAALELEGQMDDAEEADDGYVDGCLRYALSHPAEFFKTS